MDDKNVHLFDTSTGKPLNDGKPFTHKQEVGHYKYQSKWNKLYRAFNKIILKNIVYPSGNKLLLVIIEFHNLVFLSSETPKILKLYFFK